MADRMTAAEALRALGDVWRDIDEIADRLGEELSGIDSLWSAGSEDDRRDRGGPDVVREPLERVEASDAGDAECEHYDDTVHPVDDEDYKAAVWVRDHGGIDAVRERLGERKRLVDRLHAYEDALDMMADSMGVEKSSDKLAQARRMRKAVKNLECRLMPDGVEWPRYEDGELVQIGGEFMGKDGKTYTAKQIQFIGKCFSLYDFCDRKPQFSGFYGERIKRPAVLAADGEPLEVGQTVYATHYGYVKCTVLAIEWVVDGYLVEVENEGGHKFRQTPDEFAHQRPVLDADGVSIKEGDEVWTLDGGGPYTVTEPDPEHMHARVTCNTHDGKLDWGFEAAYLTHTKPESDSWERIEGDVRAMLDDGLHPNDEWVLDLLSRAKALAERGER